MTALARPRLLFCSLLLTCLASPAAVAADALPTPLTPAPGATARVEKQGDRYVLIQPRGSRTTLATDDDMLDGSEPRFTQDDFNGDGFSDLLVGIPAGPVDISNSLYLYDADANAYKRFNVPQAVSQRQNCEGLWNLTRVLERKGVLSECRGGARQHFDLLQFEPDGTVWLASQSRAPEPAVRWPKFVFPTLAVTYDQQGTILSETVMGHDEGEDQDTRWTVPVKRLALYSAPHADALTKGYLVQGDTTQMLAFDSDAWMKIAYVGKRGRIERWISLADAYGAAKAP